MDHNQEGSIKDFFISYNSADRRWAEWIAWQLEEAEYTTVLQAWDFRPGSNFVLEMQRAAKEAERTIAVLSQAYLDAVCTQPEWAAAFGRDPTGEKGTLLPVRVQECDLEGLLPQIVYVDLVGLDEAGANDALLAGVRRERAKPAAPPTFPGAVPRSVHEEPSFPGGPSPTSMSIPSLAIGEWVQSSSWRLMLRVIAVLSWTVSILWLIVEPGYEPLLAFLGGTAAFLGSFVVSDAHIPHGEEGPEQVSPVLRLLPGTGKGESAFRGVEQFSLMRGPPFRISGRYRRPVIGAPAVRDPRIVCGLYLENETSKPGRSVHVVIRILATPAPTGCELFVYDSLSVGSHLISGERDPDTGHLTVKVLFADKLVVYQDPVLVGELTVHWDANLSNGRLPESVVLDYDVYTLDGASHGEVPLLIE